jgi:lipid A 3-O-deacylase
LIRLPFLMLAAAVCLLAGAPAAPAAAQTSILDELKLGVLAHDIGFGGHHKEGGADVNLELLFASPDFLRFIWSPRPHFGADINSEGNTSNVYAGLTWGGALVSNVFSNVDSIFLQGSVGGAVHNGKIDGISTDRDKLLGSRVLFRESVELGYRYTPVQSLSLFIDHISNAKLAKHNEGLTSAGVRLGLKF